MKKIVGLIFILVTAGFIFAYRHYLFVELPKYSGSYTNDAAGRQKMKEDGLALLSHQLVDQIREKGGSKLSEEQYQSIEKNLVNCVVAATKDKNTDNLDAKQIVSIYFEPCISDAVKIKR